MFFKILLNLLLGYKEIKIEGYYIEKFINNSMKNDIFLWGLNRKNSNILDAKIGKDDFDEAVKLAQQNQCIITVESQKGIPFLWERYKKRKYIIFFILILIVSIMLLSKFVWNVQIEGNEKISTEDLLKLTEEDGLKCGVLKSKVKAQEIINKIRMSRDDIAWIGIEFRGTNAIVKIVESESKPEVVNEEDFCNIVAKKDGIITKVTAQNGTIMVNDGDEVKKGDILIAGWMEGNYTDKYFVNSNGSVKAKIRYSQTEKIDKKEFIREQNGKKEEKKSIKINNFKINFYKKLSNFKKYDTIEAEKKLQLFSNFYLPIEFIKYTNYEVDEIEVLHDYEDAKKSRRAYG